MKIGIIGGGAMGSALAKGLLLNKDINPDDIIISNPHLDKLSDLKCRGVETTSSNSMVVQQSEVLFIAVKPWKVTEVVSEIFEYLKNKPVEVCFIVAGIPGKDLKEMLPADATSNISIGMPNTAMALGKSMSFLVSLNGENLFAKNILGKVGKVKEIEERLLPAGTALASCGIAYAMRYVRAAMEGGVELGFKASETQEIITQTLNGVVALLEVNGAHPETEIDKVTTPGGITIKGLNKMEEEGFSNAVIQGLKAGR